MIAAESRSRPILFSAPMVKAILAGTKNQTRRLLKGNWQIDEHPDTDKRWPLFPSYVNDGDNKGEPAPCPYGVIGDRLWVRETWGYRGAAYAYGEGADLKHKEVFIRYRADDVRRTIIRDRDDESGIPEQICRCDDNSTEERHHEELTRYWRSWRPSIFMPRWASRITLEVTDVRVERLNDISEEDAHAEGVERVRIWGREDEIESENDPSYAPPLASYSGSFEVLWAAINGKRAPWSSNPWVWVVGFKRIETTRGAP